MPTNSLLDKVAAATRLREGPAGVATVLRAVYRAGTLRLQDAAREARLPLPVTTAIRRELEKAGILERKHGLSLTLEGRTFVEHDLGFGARTSAGCPVCNGRGIVLPENFHALIERMTAILARAPAVDVTLDQAPCTAETALLRAALMLETGGLEGKRVLLLGDDDSVSIAIGLVGNALKRPDLTRGIVALDSDQRWLDYIRGAARDEGIALETVNHDLRQPLPEAMRGAFDTVETDPPYTLEGARLFLTRAAQAFAAGGGQCFFSFTQWAPPQTLALQAVLANLGFAVQAMRPGFNRYAGASILGNTGQMIELMHAAAPASAEHGLAEWSGPLYTADINPRSRIYVCAACGTEISLGRDGGPATIEALKAAGCPACKSTTFRRQSTGS